MTEEKGVRRTLRRAALTVCLQVLLAGAGVLPARAHDIPADTTVRAFIRPEGQHLRMLVRVPMASINDIDWPVRKGSGIQVFQQIGVI